MAPSRWLWSPHRFGHSWKGYEGVVSNRVMSAFHPLRTSATCEINSPVLHRAVLHLSVLTAFLLTAAAPQPSPPEVTPSADDFLRAMEGQFSRQFGNTPGILYGDCWHVRQLQCSPARQGRSKCTYVYSRHDRPGLQGTAILERNADASWRWVSGPLQCALGVMG